MGRTGRLARIALGALVAIVAAFALARPREAVGPDVDSAARISEPLAPQIVGSAPTLLAAASRTIVPAGTLRVAVRRSRAGHAAPTAARVTFDGPYPARAMFRRRFAPVARAPAAMLDAGADGIATQAGLSPGAYLVGAVAADGARGAAWTNVAADAPSEEVLVVVTEGTIAWAGAVDHPDGSPAVGRVELSWFGDWFRPVGSTPPAASARLDATGGFRFEALPAGEVQVVLVLDDGAVRSTRVVLPAAAPWTWRVPRATPREGRVVADDDGTPVARADVSVAGFGLAAVTDDDGRYTLADGDVASLTVEARGFGRGTAYAPFAPGPLPDVRLPRSGGVIGRVVRPDGTAVSGATVHLVPGRGERTATSDAGGRVRFDDVAPGRYRTWVADSRWASREGVRDPEDSGPLSVEVPAGGIADAGNLVVEPAARIVGRVLDPDGAPVVGVEVVAAEDRFSAGVFVTGVTRAPDGGFRLEGLCAGRSYDVRAGRFEDATIETAVVAAVAPSPIVLRCGARRDVAVRVVDALTGAPVPGARVALSAVTGSLHAGLGSLVTGPDGWVAHAAVRGARIEVDATAPGYLPASLPPSNEASFEVALTPRRSPVITVRVVDEAGRPAPAALATGLMTTWTDRDGVARLAWGRHVPTVVDATAVDAAGTVRRGRTTISADANELRLEVRPTLPPRVVLVKVVGPDGEAVGRARIPTSAGLSVVDVVDGIGRLVLDPDADEVVLGPVQVGRRADGTEVAWLSEPAVVGAGVTDAVVRLGVARRLRGRVRTRDGTPVPHARVRVMPAEDETASGIVPMDNATPLATAHAGPDGRFDLGILPLAPLLLDVGATRDTVGRAGVPVASEATELDVEVATADTLDVLVVDEDGAPAAGVRVAAWRSSVSSQPDDRAPITDEGGRVTLTGLAPGVAFDVVAAQSDPRFVGVRAHDVPRGPTTGPLRLVLERARTLSGVVRAPDGRPVRDAFVSVRTADDTWAAVLSDAEGRFSFTRVGAGALVVDVGLGVEPPTPSFAEPAWRGTARVDVVLTVDPGRTMRLTCREADGKPAREVTVIAPRPPFPYYRYHVFTGDGGVRVLTALPEDWVGWAWLEPDREGRSALRGPLRPGDDVELRRGPAAPIMGLLHLPPGLSHRAVTVRAVLAEIPEIQIYGAVGADGRFTIETPAGATWVVVARAVGEGDRPGASVADVRSGTHLELDLVSARRTGR